MSIQEIRCEVLKVSQLRSNNSTGFRVLRDHGSVIICAREFRPMIPPGFHQFWQPVKQCGLESRMQTRSRMSPPWRECASFAEELELCGLETMWRIRRSQD